MLYRWSSYKASISIASDKSSISFIVADVTCTLGSPIFLVLVIQSPYDIWLDGLLERRFTVLKIQEQVETTISVSDLKAQEGNE
jgi:hypothetical protein